jgi:hypothetical protein
MLADEKSAKNKSESDGAPHSRDNFYQALRGLVLTGYYTSEAGATAELNNQIIPDHFEPCADSGPARRRGWIGEK